MSTFAYGEIRLNNPGLCDIEHLANKIDKFVKEKKLYLLFGGNATAYFRSTDLDNNNNKILEPSLVFDIVDSIVDNTATCLFSCDGVKIYVSNFLVSSGESLISRLNRVQEFLKSLCNINEISEVILFINVDSTINDIYDEIYCTPNEFANRLSILYKQYDCVPAVKLTVREKFTTS